jgi:hypothetical protein
MGLSAPYDWSNSNIKDDALIYRVLEKHRFEDVAQLCKHYGIARVSALCDGMEDRNVKAMLRRMLTNIARGFADAKGPGAAKTHA